MSTQGMNTSGVYVYPEEARETINLGRSVTCTVKQKSFRLKPIPIKGNQYCPGCGRLLFEVFEKGSGDNWRVDICIRDISCIE